MKPQPYWLCITGDKEGTRPIAWGWATSADEALTLALRNVPALGEKYSYVIHPIAGTLPKIPVMFGRQTNK